MKKHDFLIRITDDVLGIARRIEAVGEGFYVCYNKTRERFEVHNRHNLGNTRSIILPFGFLDERAYALTLMSRRVNAAELLADTV